MRHSEALVNAAGRLFLFETVQQQMFCYGVVVVVVVVVAVAVVAVAVVAAAAVAVAAVAVAAVQQQSVLLW